MTNKLTFKESIATGLKAGVFAAILNGILFYLFHGAGIITDDIFVQPDQPLTIVPVIISSILPSLIAAMIFYQMQKRMTNGFKVFQMVAVILLVLSFANPFMGIKGVTTGYALALNLMHIVVAGSLLFFIRKRLVQEAYN